MWTTILYSVIAVVVAVAFLALIFLRGLKLKEGTAVAWELAGGYCRTDISFAQHHFDAEGSIKDGSGRKSTGECKWVWRIYRGWILYPWFVEPAEYGEHNDQDGFGKGNRVFLHQLQRDIALGKVKTAKGEGVTLDMKGIPTFEVVDPWKFLYVADHDVVVRALGKIRTVLRVWVAKNTADNIQICNNVWDQIKNDPVIKEIETEWGIKVVGMSLSDIVYDLKYQEALESASRETLAAKGEAARLYAPIKAAVNEYGVSQKGAEDIRKLALGATVSIEQSDEKLDISSGGQPIDPNFAGIIGAVRTIADAYVRTKGGGKNKDNRRDKGNNPQSKVPDGVFSDDDLPD